MFTRDLLRIANHTCKLVAAQIFKHKKLKPERFTAAAEHFNFQKKSAPSWTKELSVSAPRTVPVIFLMTRRCWQEATACQFYLLHFVTSDTSDFTNALRQGPALIKITPKNPEWHADTFFYNFLLFNVMTWRCSSPPFGLWHVASGSTNRCRSPDKLKNTIGSD